jgi:hypothetical protein
MRNIKYGGKTEVKVLYLVTMELSVGLRRRGVPSLHVHTSDMDVNTMSFVVWTSRQLANCTWMTLSVPAKSTPASAITNRQCTEFIAVTCSSGF